jgi:MYXO-CTERM domain-containing protein
MGATSADAIARMYFAAGGAQFGTDSDFAAAFQVAIWELAYDYDGTLGSIDVTSGSFTGSGFSLQTDIYLAILLAAAANPLGAQADLLGLSNGDWQDQILDVSGGIPAPGAISLLGVAGLVGSRRRRN